MTDTERLSLQVDAQRRVGALYLQAAVPHGCLVLAHGAGAGMEHPWLAAMSAELAAAGISTVRFQFPYMESGSRRPDPPALCQATVRAAVELAARLAPAQPLFAGGRSFGGRMSSAAQAAAPLMGVRGLIFAGFPLHPARNPAITRAGHLREIQIPMLFLQGTRDELADLALLRQVTAGLGSRATLKLLEQADHSFHVPARSGRTDADVRLELVQTVAEWTKKLV